MSLSLSQRAFATSREPFPAFVGGYGSGKSAAAIARAMALKAHFREQNIAYYLPTYPLVKDIAYERFPELCLRKGWDFKINKGSAPFISFPGAGKILFRTMENPERIVGYEVAHSILDELDTLPINKARAVWQKVIARNRQKLPGGFPNTIGVVTTPEGFRFVHERWVKKKKQGDGYILFRAKTEDNAANLPAEYIANLRNTYTGPLCEAYLNGEFVNLTSGTVYVEYDRIKSFTNDVVRNEKRTGPDHLHIGMDFNVGKMAAIIHVLREGKPRAVAELINVFDTPAMIKLIKKRYEEHPVTIYPDASGDSRKTVNASVSDIGALKQAGFQVLNNPANPAVRDRVLSMNRLFELGDYQVNPDTCPTYVDGLEKQAYDQNGEPDKTSGWDHPLDAGGYFIAHKFPIVRRTMIVEPLDA